MDIKKTTKMIGMSVVLGAAAFALQGCAVPYMNGFYDAQYRHYPHAEPGGTGGYVGDDSAYGQLRNDATDGCNDPCAEDCGKMSMPFDCDDSCGPKECMTPLFGARAPANGHHGNPMNHHAMPAKKAHKHKSHFWADRLGSRR